MSGNKLIHSTNIYLVYVCARHCSSILQQCPGINVYMFLKKLSEEIMNEVDNVKCQGGK